MGFAVKRTGVTGQIRLGCGHHAKKEFSFLRFLHATADAELEILDGDGLIRLAVVGTHTGARAHELIDQTIVGWIARNPLGEADQPFTEYRRSFFQVPSMFCLFGRRTVAQDSIGGRIPIRQGILLQGDNSAFAFGALIFS